MHVTIPTPSLTRASTLVACALCALCVGTMGCSDKSSLSNNTTKGGDQDMRQQPDMSSTSVGEDMAMDVDMYIPPPAGPMTGLTPMRLLTRYEYDNTVSDLLEFRSGLAREGFAPENLAGGFENNAWTHGVSEPLLRQQLEAATTLSGQAWQLQKPAALSACFEGKEAECKQGFTTWLSKAYRRPVEDAERDLILGVYGKALEAEGAQAAFEVTLRTVLMSPQFLYRLELYEPSIGSDSPQDGEMTPVDFELVGPYEMAQRLSYFLWASMPDDILLEAARSGDLNTPEGIRAQFERMWQSPRAKEMVLQFHRQWLHLDAFDGLVKDTRYYPEWSTDLREDWSISINAFIEHAFWEEGTYDAFMTSPAVFMTPRLAPLYKQEIPINNGGVWKVDMPSEQRAGILTQPGLMALLAYPDLSGPIARAVFIRKFMMCQPLADPPPEFMIMPPNADPSLTTREIITELTKDKDCAGCHLLINPVGFGLEGYDAIGRWRTMENGKAVDTSGEVLGSSDPDLNKPFNGGVELATNLSQSDLVQSCMIDQWFKFALGRAHDRSDKPTLEKIKANFKTSGGKWEELMKSIILSDAFRYRRKFDAQITPKPSALEYKGVAQ